MLGSHPAAARVIDDDRELPGLPGYGALLVPVRHDHCRRQVFLHHSGASLVGVGDRNHLQCAGRLQKRRHIAADLAVVQIGDAHEQAGIVVRRPKDEPHQQRKGNGHRQQKNLRFPIP